MFRKYKALFPEDQIKPFVQKFSAIEAIYNGLNQKVKSADISEVIMKLQNVVNDSVEIVNDKESEPIHIDLSKLDFEALRKAFERIGNKNKIVYDLQKAIDKQLKRMLDQNPSRMEFYDKYQKIIDAYNNGKDAEATRKAFKELVKFLAEMDEEEHRAAQEGLDEETLAIYDLLKKDKLSKKESDEVKNVAKDTLAKLKAEKLKVQRWRESTQITAQVQTMIHDTLLYLPQKNYADEEVDSKTVEVYQHIYSNYYGGGMSSYNSFVA